MKKLVQAVTAAAIYCVSPFAVASFDDMSCRWDSGCALGGSPYLDPDNDTRANLLMLLAEQRGFPIALPALPQEVSRSRSYAFGVFKGSQQPVADDQSAQTPALTPSEIALNAMAAKVGIAPSVLSEVSVENEGRWVSNNKDSLGQFFSALLADQQLDQPDRDLLALRRVAIYRGEQDTDRFLPLMQHFVAGSHAAAFRDYLSNAERFYQGKFPEAEAGFLDLKESDQPWVAETATYMLFRVALNQATEHAVDEYGMFEIDKVNKQAAELALQRAEGYLTAHPGGAYVDSVRGLYRRVYWYLADWQNLAQLYESQLASAKNIDSLSALIDENDQILLSRLIPYKSAEQPFTSVADTPLQTFTQTMKWLRKYSIENKDSPKVTAEVLQSYKPMFEKANMLPVWQYMHNAWLFYQQKDYPAVLATIKPADQLAANDIVAFSQQVMYGNALSILNKLPEAEAHWRHLLTLKLSPYQQQYLQLMLATNLVQNNNAAAIFAPESPINNLRYRALVLKTLANKALLQQQAASAPTDEEKTIALHTLLIRDLMAGDYQGYLEDKLLKKPIRSTLDPEAFGDVDLATFDWNGSDTEQGYFCAPLEQTAAVLAKNKTDAHALNCLGEFFRTTALAQINTEPELEGNEALEVLARLAMAQHNEQGRLAYYQWVIADPKAEPEDKTYALYRAVMCFSPSGYNGCDRQEIPKEMRQRWFNQLKKNYKGNQWEKRLKYYW
ncbi:MULTISPECIES: hypothetical protein [unclassified Serratia (in: enterobacteria)]|uniref:hypothetical protein n=1 Tax=unclassified Serratia (in: enterobacteria) TaxID=2647522 RepID=UPI00068DAADB|nr:MULTISPECIES: hypothetical protein [unclassified Serratia (in: enterobacteria)]